VAVVQPLSEEDMVWALFNHLGLPRRPSNDDVVLWWSRASALLGATAAGMGGRSGAQVASAVAADGHHTTVGSLALRGFDIDRDRAAENILGVPVTASPDAADRDLWLDSDVEDSNADSPLRPQLMRSLPRVSHGARSGSLVVAASPASSHSLSVRGRAGSVTPAAAAQSTSAATTASSSSFVSHLRSAVLAGHAAAASVGVEVHRDRDGGGGEPSSSSDTDSASTPKNSKRVRSPPQRLQIPLPVIVDEPARLLSGRDASDSDSPSQRSAADTSRSDSSAVAAAAATTTVAGTGAAAPSAPGGSAVLGTRAAMVPTAAASAAASAVDADAPAVAAVASSGAAAMPRFEDVDYGSRL
jgi:hypothetical protein